MGDRLTSHKRWWDHPVEIHALVSGVEMMETTTSCLAGWNNLQYQDWGNKCTTCWLYNQQKSLPTVRGCDKSNLFKRIHPGRLTWNIIIEVGKIIFLSKWGIGRFHVNLPGCIIP